MEEYYSKIGHQHAKKIRDSVRMRVLSTVQHTDVNLFPQSTDQQLISFRDMQTQIHQLSNDTNLDFRQQSADNSVCDLLSNLSDNLSALGYKYDDSEPVDRDFLEMLRYQSIVEEKTHHLSGILEAVNERFGFTICPPSYCEYETKDKIKAEIDENENMECLQKNFKERLKDMYLDILDKDADIIEMKKELEDARARRFGDPPVSDELREEHRDLFLAVFTQLVQKVFVKERQDIIDILNFIVTSLRSEVSRLIVEWNSKLPQIADVAFRMLAYIRSRTPEPFFVNLIGILQHVDMHWKRAYSTHEEDVKALVLDCPILRHWKNYYQLHNVRLSDGPDNMVAHELRDATMSHVVKQESVVAIERINTIRRDMCQSFTRLFASQFFTYRGGPTLEQFIREFREHDKTNRMQICGEEEERNLPTHWLTPVQCDHRIIECTLQEAYQACFFQFRSFNDIADLAVSCYERVLFIERSKNYQAKLQLAPIAIPARFRHDFNSVDEIRKRMEHARTEKLAQEKERLAALIKDHTIPDEKQKSHSSSVPNSLNININEQYQRMMEHIRGQVHLYQAQANSGMLDQFLLSTQEHFNNAVQTTETGSETERARSTYWMPPPTVADYHLARLHTRLKRMLDIESRSRRRQHKRSHTEDVDLSHTQSLTERISRAIADQLRAKQAHKSRHVQETESLQISELQKALRGK